MTSPQRDTDDLAAATRELVGVLRELRDEVGPPRPPRRRPPTPGEFLRFAESRAIPAAVATLEAAIRTLELLAATIRLLEGRPPDDRPGDATRDRAGGTRIGVESLGREALDRLDGALADLQAALEGEPTDPEAGRLLAEARDLREEIDRALADRPSPNRAPARPDGRHRSDDGSDRDDAAGPDRGTPDSPSDAGGSGVEIDVESELDSIREEVDRERDRRDEE